MRREDAPPVKILGRQGSASRIEHFIRFFGHGQKILVQQGMRLTGHRGVAARASHGHRGMSEAALGEEAGGTRAAGSKSPSAVGAALRQASRRDDFKPSKVALVGF